jgi:hypothetical protein
MDLVLRGHRLVADDVVLIRLTRPFRLIGRGEDLIRYHMEIRGVGILNIQDLFGITAIRDEKEVELVIELDPALPPVIANAPTPKGSTLSLKTLSQGNSCISHLWRANDGNRHRRVFVTVAKILAEITVWFRGFLLLVQYRLSLKQPASSHDGIRTARPRIYVAVRVPTCGYHWPGPDHPPG